MTAFGMLVMFVASAVLFLALSLVAREAIEGPRRRLHGTDQPARPVWLDDDGRD